MDLDSLSDEELIALHGKLTSKQDDLDSLSDEDLIKLHASKVQNKKEATWGETIQGGLAQLGKNLGLGGLGVAGGIDELGKMAYEPVRKTLAALGTNVQTPDSGIGEALATTKKYYEEADPTRGKDLSPAQRFTQGGIQLAGGLAGGPVGMGALMAGGSVDQGMSMLDEGMSLDKAQQFMGADAALNTASMGLGGFGKSVTGATVTGGLGNLAGDEASHWLANKFREDAGLKTNKDRDWVDRTMSFTFGAAPTYVAKKIEATAKAKADQLATEQAEAAKQKAIDDALSKQQPPEPTSEPQRQPRDTLELLPEDMYPEPLGNRTVDPDTGTTTTGMAEDVPTIDFPLRAEALANDKKFQKLQKDLLTERQILEDWETRGVDEESLTQQRQAVEEARQKLGDYLDQGYGAKQPSDLYGRALYESGDPKLKVEHPFNPNEKTPIELVDKVQEGRKSLGVLDIDASAARTTPDFFNKLREHVEAGDYNGALGYIASTRKGTIEGNVAKLLMKLGDSDVKLFSRDNLATERDGTVRAVNGAYTPSEHAVYITSLLAGDYKTFIHEAVHAASVGVINRILDGNTKNLSVAERINGKKMVDLYNEVRQKLPEAADYGFKNAKEFVSEVFSNQSFRDVLANVKNGNMKFHERFIDSVRGMMGLSKLYTTALDRALHTGNKILKNSERGTRLADLGKPTRGTLNYTEADLAPPSKLDRFTSFDEFKNSLPKELQDGAAKYWVTNGRELPKSEATVSHNQPTVDAIAKITGDDRIKYMVSDLRSAEEIKPVILNHKVDISDNALRNSLASRGWAMSMLTKHPLVSWVNSKVMNALKEAEIKSETQISETGKGFMAILKGQDFFSPTGKEAIKTITAKVMAMEGNPDHNIKLTPWEQRVVDSHRKAMKETYTALNEMRQAKGLKPVTERINYLATLFNGNFRMMVQKDGKTVGWITGDSKIELNAAKEKFNDGSYTFSPVENIPFSRSKDFQKTIARRMAAFDEVIKILGEDDPEVIKFADRLQGMYSKQAYDYLDFKQHFKNKTGVFGGEGYKSWKEQYSNAVDLWTAQAEYLRTANQWIAQQKVNADLKTVLNDPDIRNHAPNAAHLAKDIYDNAFGRTQGRLEIVENLADAFVKTINSDFITNIPVVNKIQKVNPYEVARATKNWALYGTLGWNGLFAGTQLVQTVTASSTMMAHLRDLGFQGNPLRAATLGISDVLNGIPQVKESAQRMAKMFGEEMPNGFVSEVGRYFNQYAYDNHISAPHILEKTDLYSGNRLIKAGQRTSEVMGWSISAPEKATRHATFNILAHYLYDSGVPAEMAAQMAEHATSVAMVDYSREARASIYNKLGMLGEMAATVTTFKHNAYTQLGIYGKTSPRATMMMLSMQLALGGMTGFFAFNEADTIYGFLKDRKWFREMFGETQGLKEFVIRNTPEMFSYGVASSASRHLIPEGIDIGTKFSMDQLLPGSLKEALFPLISSVENTYGAAGKFASVPTARNAAGILYPMSPAPVKAALEDTMFTDKKGALINPKTDKKDRTRTTNERAVRYLGGRSLDERKANDIAFMQQNKDLRNKEIQTEYLTNIRSYIASGDMKSAIPSAVHYINNGGQPQNVINYFTKAQMDLIQDKLQRLNSPNLNTLRGALRQRELMNFKEDVY